MTTPTAAHVRELASRVEQLAAAVDELAAALNHNDDDAVARTGFRLLEGCHRNTAETGRRAYRWL
ncbi:hypothetical protein [Nonomuraea dietziae]|uniref:hypothetical protein n=1 Tax=Nonomuraea dietziae TaxID=65515 RepID=UPI003420F493